MGKKLSELELDLKEYFSYSGPPSETSEVFLQHLSRYEFFARRIIASLNISMEKVDLSETSLDGVKILDVGCGKGFGSYFLAKLGAQVTGIDWNREIINWAQKKYASKDLTFITGDACNLSLSDNCYDAVCAMDLIEHLVYPQRFLMEVRRVLKGNGILMFSTPNHLKHLIKTGEIYPFHEREYLYSEFVDFAEKHCERYELFGQCPNWVDKICESIRHRDFTKAPISKIAKFKLINFIKKLIPKSVKTKLSEKSWQVDFSVITYDKVKTNTLYNSITFVKDRYETCSDFILITFREDIRSQ